MVPAQTLWPLELSMPAQELESSLDAPYGVSTGSWKRHKTLPHPREQRLPDFYSALPSLKPRILTIDTGINPSPPSQGSSPRILKHASRRIGAPDLPPTPPAHSRQSSGNQTIASISSRGNATKSTSVPTTPINERSPPTPEVTPPRRAMRPEALHAPTGDPSTASRTDSFRTAREDPYSSDEDEMSTVRPILPSTQSSEADIRAARLTSEKREIGLGLDLESEVDHTPTFGKRRSTMRDGIVFDAFDGEWSGREGELSKLEQEWDDNLMRNVTVRRRLRHGSQEYGGSPSTEVYDEHLVSPTNATRLVREYSLDDNSTSTLPTVLGEDRSPTKDFSGNALWPNGIIAPESPATPDLRRFSVMSVKSITSAVVEAIVVDKSPQRTQTLRHTKKQIGLRDFTANLPTQDSVRSRSISDDFTHRLHHQTGKLPDRKHRSLQSNSTGSTSSGGPSRRDIWKSGAIPVIVVPQRQSSMKSPKTPSLRSMSSRRSKRTASLSSAPLSLSARANEPGYFDIIKRGHRRSVDDGSSPGSQRTLDFPPQIPVRRSSLSAPTSRNASRAGSLTAESLRAHERYQATEAWEPKSAQTFQSTDSQKDGSRHGRAMSVDQNGDPLFGSRLTSMLTPFSQASNETTGTSAEVAEAMAMNLYPHQNRSVLVVEQQAPSGSSGHTSGGFVDDARQPSVAVNGDTVNEPLTPTQAVQMIDEIDSPLRNPRDPPQPPAIKFIPPTPNVLTPSDEADHQLGNAAGLPPTSEKAPKRGLSLIRRALATRRYSEGIISRTFSIKRRNVDDEFSQTSRSNSKSGFLYPSVSDQPADESKLHPFWRPAHFWDDLEDDDDDLGQYPDLDAYPRIDNRPSRPKRSISGSLKRTFAILPIRDDVEELSYPMQRRTIRRTDSGNLKVTKHRGSSDNLHRASSDKRYQSPPSYTSASGMNYNPWVGLKSLTRRMSKKRRGGRNEKPRKLISAPRDVVDGVDMVLRGQINSERPVQERIDHEGPEEIQL